MEPAIQFCKLGGAAADYDERMEESKDNVRFRRDLIWFGRRWIVWSGRWARQHGGAQDMVRSGLDLAQKCWSSRDGGGPATLWLYAINKPRQAKWAMSRQVHAACHACPKEATSFLSRQRVYGYVPTSPDKCTQRVMPVLRRQRVS
ncbi:hypothetical protein ACLB2K_035242 [Fragaria x ananassa]